MLRGQPTARCRHRLLIDPILRHVHERCDEVGPFSDHHLRDGLDSVLQQVVYHINDGVHWVLRIMLDDKTKGAVDWYGGNMKWWTPQD